jgi:hypothetical protein
MLAIAAMLSGCGGSDGNTNSAGGGAGGAIGVTPTPTPTATAGCSLRERQDWAAAQLREWYLFPDTLPATLSPAGYTTVDSYIDALTATARAQRKDRFFTYLTSIKEENAYYASGSSAGFGIRFALDQTGQRLFAAESFEGAPALAAGIDRGAEILAIGTTSSNLRTVSAIISAEGTAGLTTAFGPDTTGTARVFRVSDAAGTRDVTVAKADFSLLPVSSRYGAKIIDDGGQRVGYINLRTFISTAEPALKTAFANFRAQGVTKVIIDLRYNGGGLVATSEYLGDLLGGGRSTSDVPHGEGFEQRDALLRATTRVDRADADRIHRQRRHRIGERTFDQCVHPVFARQFRADRNQYLRQARRADRPRQARLRRSPSRDRLRDAERGAQRQLLRWPRIDRRGDVSCDRRHQFPPRRRTRGVHPSRARFPGGTHMLGDHQRCQRAVCTNHREHPPGLADPRSADHRATDGPWLVLKPATETVKPRR